MNGEERKAAISAYKERKVAGGVYAVRCTITGVTWVGRWPDVDAIQNRIWFTLRLGIHPNRDLLKAWQQHGPENIQFEVLERLDQEELAYVRDALLKERMAHWQSSLGAKPL